MEGEPRSDHFTEVEDRFAGYEVYDRNYEKVGKVDDLFVDESDNPEYIGVKMGFLGTKSTLIPFEIVRVNDKRQLVQVGADKDTIKDAPNFDDDQEITPELEERVYTYFGLERPTTTEARRAYGVYYSSSASTLEEGVEPAPGERTGVVMTDKDELRVQRSEEELRAGTREREAGAVRVRKRVRTDRKTMEVPKRRQEVSVDRVPVEGETSGTEIGDEVRIPVTEEEVVVEKRPVVKEEIRIRKEVVEDTEVVEEDVRREEVDIDDQTTRRRDI
jgi:uncharacterized protein (TIGR02271 family)